MEKGGRSEVTEVKWVKGCESRITGESEEAMGKKRDSPLVLYLDSYDPTRSSVCVSDVVERKIFELIDETDELKGRMSWFWFLVLLSCRDSYLADLDGCIDRSELVE